MGPIKFFSLITFGAAAGLAAAFWWILSFDFVLSWILAMTLVAFLTYGYDKTIAGSGQTRVPEKVLLALALAGGTIGTFAGRAFFRHKTIKSRFRAQLWIVVSIQLLFVFAYLVWIR